MRKTSVLVTVILMGIVLSVSVVNATWCNNDYDKRINVSINNTAGSAVTDYQVYVNLSSNPINETSLRVYNATSCTLRSYWSENTTAGNSYGIWINYSAIAASGWTNDTSIYYNKTGANSVSNGPNTFLQWHGTATSDFLDALLILPSISYVWEGKVKATSATFNVLWGLASVADQSDDCSSIQSNNDNRYFTQKVDGTHTVIQEALSLNVDQYYRGKIVFNSTLGKGYFDNNEISSGGISTNLPNSNMGLWMMAATGTCAQEWSFVRKYSSVEPSSTLGSEEDNHNIALTLIVPMEDQEFSTTTIWINGSTNVNATVNFSIDAGTNETACTNCLSFSNLTSTLSEGSHNVTVYAINYTDSYDTDIETRNFTINSLAPQWGNQTQNVSFIYENGSINLSANGYDVTGLNYAWLATNETGTWQNFTTSDQNVNDYQLLTQVNLGAQDCAGCNRFRTGYGAVTGDHSKFLYHHTPHGAAGQILGYGWYYIENNTWNSSFIIMDSEDADADSLIVMNNTHWMSSYRTIPGTSLYRMWSNDSGATWGTASASPFNGITGWVAYIPIENDTEKVWVQWIPNSDSTKVYQKFFYLGNESFGTETVAWTISGADHSVFSDILCVDGTYYVYMGSNTGYAQYRTSINLINWSGTISTGVVRQTGLGYGVDCDDYNCYMVLGHSDLTTRLYSTNKTDINTTNWTYRLDLNVSNSGIGSVKIINNTHLVASNQEHTAHVQYGMFVKTHTITNSQYGSPIDLGGSTNWEWANFTWQNADYNNTKIYWKICFNDTSGLTNCTNVMGFDITENAATPVISNVVNGSISPTSQYIDWDVNQIAHNRVLYSNESDLTPAYYSTWDNSTAVPNITLSGLDASTQYWYQAWSYNTTNTSLNDNSSTLSFTTASESTYIPPDPTTLANTTGNFWVNHTWNTGSGNVTNSYNVSVNLTWHNGTTNLYYNNTPLSAHNWSNVSVWAYNTSGSGTLSASSISQNTQIPNNVPVLSGLPDNTTTEDVNQTDIFDLDDYYTDLDGDTATYLVESNNQSGNVSVTINASNNVSYTLANGWNGTAEVVINATDGWGGEDNDTFLIIVNAPPLPGDYMPGNPTTLGNTTGNYWVNYTWNVGGGNVTDSYNVSWNLTWYNTTTDEFMKKEVGASNWANITVFAYNSSGNGSLSAGSVSDNVQAPAFVPGDYTPPNPTTLANSTGNYWVNYTWVMGVPGNVTDSYNVSWNLTWYNTTLTPYMQKDVGASNWGNITVYAYNSSGNGTLSDGSLSDNVQAPAYAPGDYPPATPTTLANTTSNGWVNYTWNSGGGANVTDSYNVSWNLTWYNTTLTAYMNDSVGEFGWANITAYAYNATGNGSLSAGSVSDDTQAGGGTFTTSMGTTVYNLITYYGSSNSTAEQFGVDIGSVDYIAMYNGSFYTHTMGFSANNFTTVHGIGYYVYLNASGSSTYSRNNISDTLYNTQLFNRWNTIGWTNATDTNAEGVASSIGSACKYTSSLNADGVTYTTHTVGFTSNNHAVEKGEGYWIWVNTGVSWGRNS